MSELNKKEKKPFKLKVWMIILIYLVIAISVTCAPLARILVNASCPGVSKNVIVLPLISILQNIVKNSMSCHRFTLTLCHNLIHFLVTDSGAIAPDF